MQDKSVWNANMKKLASHFTNYQRQ